MPALLAAVCLAQAAFAAPASGATVGEIGSLAVLLGIPKVRTELALTRSQQRALDEIRGRYASGMRHLGVGGDASCAERAEALRVETNTAALLVLSPAQRRLLPGIERRAAGATLVYSPVIRKELGLTERQHARIERIRAGAAVAEERINRKYEDGKIDRADRLEMLREDRLSRAAKIWDVLTPEQRRRFWEPAHGARKPS